MTKLYTYVCWGIDDGMPPFVKVERTLGEIKAGAVAAVQYMPEIEGPCDACEERATRSQERPDDECQCECHQDTGAGGWLEASCDEAVQQVRSWDGTAELTVFYWEGDEGYLTLGVTDLPDEG